MECKRKKRVHLQFRVRSECADAAELHPAEPEGKDQLEQLSLVAVAVLGRGGAVRSRAAAPIAHPPSEQPWPCVRRNCFPVRMNVSRRGRFIH